MLYAAQGNQVRMHEAAQSILQFSKLNQFLLCRADLQLVVLGSGFTANRQQRMPESLAH